MWSLVTFNESESCDEYCCESDIEVLVCPTAEDLQLKFNEMKLAEDRDNTTVLYYIFKGVNLMEGDWDNPEEMGGLDIDDMIDTAHKVVKNTKEALLKEREEKDKRDAEFAKRRNAALLKEARERTERNERDELFRLAAKYGYTL